MSRWREETIERRFWDKVAWSTDDTACWPWMASKRAGGYGQFLISGTFVGQAHRLAYELEVGPIPDGLQLDHLCRNTACCNPSHLEPVTPRENYLRGVGFAADNARKTHCKWGHPFEGDNLYSRYGKRWCQTCRRRNERTSRARRAIRP